MRHVRSCIGMISHEERSCACYKANRMCVEMIVHFWFCLSSDLDFSVMMHTSLNYEKKTKKNCISLYFSLFLYKWLFYKMNLLWCRFCLFFSFWSETLHSSLCSSFWNLSTKYKKINKTNRITQYSVILSFGGEHFELCFVLGFVFFLNVFIQFRFYWCLQNKC